MSRAFRRVLVMLPAVVLLLACQPGFAEEPFRPQAGVFPPLAQAHPYRGQLIFVDHANRRGSLRVAGDGMFFRNSPHPFAMLPYGTICYHGAAAELQDIPLGIVLHARGFLPPDPKLSAVPVLPVNNKDKDANHNRGDGIFPAENHLLLLEDELSYCLREGKVWRLNEVTIRNRAGQIIACRGAADAEAAVAEAETFTFDAATRIWRGREALTVADLVAEDSWPAEGKRALDGQVVQLGINWKPTPDGVFTRFHLSDIWLDDTTIERARQQQAESHKAFIRSRWMPAWVDAVDYGSFGRATITVTLFGGMDPTLYSDFQKGQQALMNAAENTLRHTGGQYGPGHMASRGSIVEVIQATEEPPLGSSGIQIRFETDLIIEGLRPQRVVRVCPTSWPQVNLPREEYLGDGTFTQEDRFPTPDIFPKYE